MIDVDDRGRGGYLLWKLELRPTLPAGICLTFVLMDNNNKLTIYKSYLMGWGGGGGGGGRGPFGFGFG